MKKLIALLFIIILSLNLAFSQKTKIGGRAKIDGKATANKVSGGGGGGEDLDNGLVAFWKLGEATGTTRNDSVGTNHLTDSGGTVGSITGKIGNAAGFDEQGSWLTIADNTPLSITGNITIVAWPRLSASLTFDFGGIAAKWGTSSQRSYGILYDRTGAIGGTANRYLMAGSPDGDATRVYAVANNFGAPAAATWYFVVGFIDVDTDVIGISVDDGTINTTAYTSSIFDSTASFDIGRMATAGDFAFEGDIDAVGIWSRRLTATEITCLRNGGAGQEPPFAPCP